MNKYRRILFILLCLYAGAIHAQRSTILSRPYHSSLDKATIREFLDDISNHSGVFIEYAAASIETGKIVTLIGSPSTMGSLLQQVLRGQKISILEKNDKIILVPSPVALPENALINFYSIFGYIKEQGSEEPLAAATIWESSMQKGALSNAHGYFALMLPEGRHILRVSYIGYGVANVEVDVTQNARLDIRLEPKTEEQLVVITSSNTQKKDESSKTNTWEDIDQAMLNEPDALGSLYLLPGVKNAPEIASGMLVRGGSPDQNIFLLDGNPVFNPTHLLGTLSIVNKTSFKSMYLYKSNFPACFGGGLSSVIDVLTKDGNMQKWKGEANVGILAGSFTLEGPLKKDQTAIMLSARQSWVNPFLRLAKAGIGVNFNDIHLKITQVVGANDKLFFNVYSGHDKLNMQKDNTNNQQQWGNQGTSVAWNHLMGARAFVRTMAGYTRYNNIAGFRYALYDSTGGNVQNKVYNTFFSIEQYHAGTQVEISASNSLRINFGAKYSYTKIKPFDTNIATDFADKPDDFTEAPALSFRELVVYYENEIKGNNFFIRPGIHVSHFQNGNFQYTSWQPRFYAVYKVAKNQQLSFSFNHMTQYLHLVTNPYLGINSDVWVPSTALLRPEESNMVNVGYMYSNRKKIMLSAEVYYKAMQNVTNYAEGKNLFLNNGEWEQNIQSGKGWCYGLEVKGVKKSDKWETYVGYTLSWNWRQFDDINDGKKFPFKYDRRHQLDIATTYKYNVHWSFYALWTFATSDVFTLPDRIYPDFDDAQQIRNPLAPQEYHLIYHSSTANQYRTLPYHRLEISVSNYHQLGKKINSRLTAGAYNVYGSPNQYVYDVEGALGKRSLVVTTKYQFMSVTPYVSYTINF